MAIIDTTTYNGEAELFEIRYNVLKDYVDEFRVIQFDTTFSGKKKEYIDWINYPKVVNYLYTEKTWGKYRDLALASPNTEYGKGAEHWITEFCQKESIKDALVDLDDLDRCFIGDCDEIWNPLVAQLYPKEPFKLPLQVYSYWLNNKSSEEFKGTLYALYRDIKSNCLNELRSAHYTYWYPSGWHFTSMGGYERVKDKLQDSYTEQTYASQPIIDKLKENIDNNKDFLGRNFTYHLDESEWPQYLKDTKDKYKHLCL